MKYKSVKIVKCSCLCCSPNRDIHLSKPSKFWYHDKIGEVFIVTDSESGLLKVDETSCILPEDCVPLEDHRQSQLDKLI